MSTHCLDDFQKTGVGLLGESLSGAFSFIFDTANYDSFIKNISYTPNNYDTNVSSLSAYYQISNYQCDFDRKQYTYIDTNPYYVSALNLSGRYVQMFFDIRRDAITSVSPRIYDADVDFSYTKKEYDYKTIYKYKNDIYGFEYTLLKEDLELDLYNYKNIDGDVLVKTLKGKVITLEELLPTTFDKYKNIENLYSQMVSGIKDMELFFDTLMFITSGYVVFEKLIYSYSSDVMSVDQTNSYFLDLNALSARYSDIWFFEQENFVLTFLFKDEYISNRLVFTPMVYKLDFVNNKFFEIEVENKEKFYELSALDIDAFETPVVTFDNYRSNFNIGSLVYKN
jgi:hypothetical protein